MQDMVPLKYLRIAVKNPTDTRGCFIDYAYRVYSPEFMNEDPRPLVLISGFTQCQDSSSWFNLIKYLSKSRTIITLDHRGIGHSKFVFANNKTKIASNIRLQFSVQEMADDIYALISYLLLNKSKVDVLGLSMGGMIAQRYALTYPQTISHLILCSTTPASGTNMPFFDTKLSKQYLANNLALRKCKTLDEFRKQVRINLEFNLSPDFVLTNKRVDEYITEGMKIRNPIQVIKAQWKALKVYDGIKDLEILHKYSEKFGFGILIIHGDCDKTIDFRNGVFMHKKLPSSKLCILKREGHLIFETQHGLDISLKNIQDFCENKSVSIASKL